MCDKIDFKNLKKHVINCYEFNLIMEINLSEFVHTCIKKILRLYKDAENKPSTVILVGHSMVRNV